MGPQDGVGLPRWAQVGAKRLAHIERVVGLIGRWAEAMTVSPGERERWLRAAWLHDALRDAPDAELARLAPSTPGPAELRHGPAAAARAKAEGEADRGVLDAVRYHSIGLADWDMVGRVLYCADYLEPGRTFEAEWRADLAARFPADTPGVLREVASARMTWLVQSGWAIPEPTWHFWNALASAPSSPSS